jgi:hypothetical protein
VVDEAMGCFVRTNCVDDIEHFGVWLNRQ